MVRNFCFFFALSRSSRRLAFLLLQSLESSLLVLWELDELVDWELSSLLGCEWVSWLAVVSEVPSFRFVFFVWRLAFLHWSRLFDEWYGEQVLRQVGPLIPVVISSLAAWYLTRAGVSFWLYYCWLYSPWYWISMQPLWMDDCGVE